MDTVKLLEVKPKTSSKAVLIYMLSKVLDIFGALLTPLIATVSLVQSRGGARRLPLTYKVWDFFGVQPVSHHYYQPVFNVHALPDKTWNDVDKLEGINFHVDDQVKLLSDLRYGDELLAFPIEFQESDPLGYYYNNHNYSSGDAEILYSMVRHLKPSRIIEVGSGFSTRITKAALDRNASDTGFDAKHICIEPYEMKWLEHLNLDQIIRSKVEDVGHDVFQQLEEGDILFIDSSHVIRTGGDVVAEYLKILPCLKKGVIVHVHDIFLPYDYPKSWIQEERRFWDEQYLLQAFLAFNNSYSTILACHYLARCYENEFGIACPIYASKFRKLPVTSFWMKRIF